jgi:hypothetical protein
MDSPAHERIEGMIHEAMPRNPAQASEALANQSHRVVAAFTGARVSDVQVAVVDDFNRNRL